MNYSFTDYEEAVKNALADLEKRNGGYLADLAGYAGQLDSEEAIRLWRGRFPAVAVDVRGATYPESGRTNAFWQQKIQVFALVGAHSYRGQAEARGGQAGSHIILQDIRSRLLGKTLGLEIRECIIVQESVLASDQNSVIHMAEYQIINDRIMEDLP